MLAVALLKVRWVDTYSCYSVGRLFQLTCGSVDRSDVLVAGYSILIQKAELAYEDKATAPSSAHLRYAHLQAVAAYGFAGGRHPSILCK